MEEVRVFDNSNDRIHLIEVVPNTVPQASFLELDRPKFRREAFIANEKRRRYHPPNLAIPVQPKDETFCSEMTRILGICDREVYSVSKYQVCDAKAKRFDISALPSEHEIHYKSTFEPEISPLLQKYEKLKKNSQRIQSMQLHSMMDKSYHSSADGVITNIYDNIENIRGEDTPSPFAEYSKQLEYLGGKRTAFSEYHDQVDDLMYKLGAPKEKGKTVKMYVLKPLIPPRSSPPRSPRMLADMSSDMIPDVIEINKSPVTDTLSTSYFTSTLAELEKLSPNETSELTPLNEVLSEKNLIYSIPQWMIDDNKAEVNYQMTPATTRKSIKDPLSEEMQFIDNVIIDQEIEASTTQLKKHTLRNIVTYSSIDSKGEIYGKIVKGDGDARSPRKVKFKGIDTQGETVQINTYNPKHSSPTISTATTVQEDDPMDTINMPELDQDLSRISSEFIVDDKPKKSSILKSQDSIDSIREHDEDREEGRFLNRYQKGKTRPYKDDRSGFDIGNIKRDSIAVINPTDERASSEALKETSRVMGVGDLNRIKIEPIEFQYHEFKPAQLQRSMSTDEDKDYERRLRSQQLAEEAMAKRSQMFGENYSSNTSEMLLEEDALLEAEMAEIEASTLALLNAANDLVVESIHHRHQLKKKASATDMDAESGKLVKRRPSAPSIDILSPEEEADHVEIEFVDVYGKIGVGKRSDSRLVDRSGSLPIYRQNKKSLAGETLEFADASTESDSSDRTPVSKKKKNPFTQTSNKLGMVYASASESGSDGYTSDYIPEQMVGALTSSKDMFNMDAFEVFQAPASVVVLHDPDQALFDVEMLVSEAPVMLEVEDVGMESWEDNLPVKPKGFSSLHDHMFGGGHTGMEKKLILQESGGIVRYSDGGVVRKDSVTEAKSPTTPVIASKEVATVLLRQRSQDTRADMQRRTSNINLGVLCPTALAHPISKPASPPPSTEESVSALEGKLIEVEPRPRDKEEESDAFLTGRGGIDILAGEGDVALEYDFNETQVETFRQIFDMYDKNGDNVINVEELRGILEILGYSPSPEEVERILVKFDQDESGTIDFDEYLCLIQTWIEQDEEQIYEAFKVFDKDGDGFVSAQELKRALTQYGEQFTEEEANEFFNMMDTDGDGVINYEEFVEYLRSMQKYSTE